MAEDREQGEVSYVKAALKWQYNWIAMAGAAGFAVVSGSALPLLLGAGLELMYLSTVPQNSRFQRLVRSWKFEDQKREREKSLSALFYELPPEMRARYAHLDQTSKIIRENYARLTSTSQLFTDQMETKLTGSGAVLHPAAERRVSPPRIPARHQQRHHQERSGAAREGPREGLAQGAGDQPQAHRDPEQARAEVREDAGEL